MARVEESPMLMFFITNIMFKKMKKRKMMYRNSYK